MMINYNINYNINDNINDNNDKYVLFFYFINKN